MLPAQIERSWIEATLRYATYVLLAGLGVLLGTIGCFLVPQRLGSFGEIAAVVAVAGNLTTGFMGSHGVGTRAGAIAPFAGWLVAVGMLALGSGPSRGGDVVIPGALGNAPSVVRAGYIFMLAGVVASVVPILLSSRYTERVNPPKSIS